VPATGGQAVAVTKLDRQGSHRAPVFLPDARRFLYYALGIQDESGIYLGSLDSPETTRLTAAETGGVYLAGWLLWVRSGSLVAQRLDLERKRLTGDVITFAEPVAFDANTSMSALSASTSGLLAYRTGAGSRRQLAWFDRSGKPLGTFGERDENGLSAPSVSSDGRRVVLYRTMQGNADIWLADAVRATRFTFDAALDRFPVWSPDGSRVVFDSNRNGKRNLYQKASSGAGGESSLLESSQDKLTNDWSLDGRFLLYHSTDPQTNRDLWVLPMEGDRKPWVFLKTPFNERFGVFSPDGRWVAYMSNESGRDEIYIRPFAVPTASGANASAAGGQWQVSTAGGIYPRWRHDGRELYYLGPRGEMMAAPIVATATALTPGAPVLLFPTLIYGGGVDTQLGRQYDVTRDGRFLLNTVVDDATTPITLLMHWNPAAKK
jgi:Tol biopolymer transport system component